MRLRRWSAAACCAGVAGASSSEPGLKAPWPAAPTPADPPPSCESCSSTSRAARGPSPSATPALSRLPWSMPSLEELRGRAAPWAEHLRVQQAWPGRPAAYLLRGILSEKEIQEMFGLAAATLQGNRTEWHSKVHAVSSLHYVPDAASAAPVRALNARLATLVGLPQSHVEEGYLNLYKAGYELTGLHLDNHHVLFSPPRVASVVMYLTGEDEGLDGGCTVFPLAGAAADSPDDQEISDKASRWDARLSSSTAEFELGKNPMWGRACPLSLQASWPEGDLCLDALARARELCASGCNRSAPEAASPAGALAHARRRRPECYIHAMCVVFERRRQLVKDRACAQAPARHERARRRYGVRDVVRGRDVGSGVGHTESDE